MAGITVEAAINAALLGSSGIVLMAVGSQGGGQTAPSGSSGGGSGSTRGKGPWRARDDIDGMRGHEGEVARDIEGIAAGRATWSKSLSRYKINGRTYGIEESGTVFPDSGLDIVNLNRVEYGALREIVRARGDISAAPRLARDPKFVENPEAIEKALKIYNGIIP